MRTGRELIKAMVPKEAAVLTRSFHSAARLNLLPQWLATFQQRHSRIRLGSEYGGWVIPAGTLNARSICYCVGCGEDISFDLALLERYSCPVYGFDPTPRAIEYVRKATSGIEGYRFFETAIWTGEGTVKFFSPVDPRHVSHSITNLARTEHYMEVPARRLSAVMHDLGHDRLTLLKLDIEGAENEVIRTIAEDGVAIDILLVEFDELGFPSPERIARMKASLRTLFEHGFRLFNISRNNFTFIHQGRSVPVAG